MMKLNIGTRLGLGFGIQILLTGVLGISVLFGMANVQGRFRFVVEHNAPVIANAKQLSKLVVDMENGERGFVITGKEEFLEPYNSGAKEFAALMEEEKKLVSDNPSQVAALEQIESLIEEWKTKAARPEIAMARKVEIHWIDVEYFQAVLSRGVGKNLMDEFMTVGHDLEISFSERGDWEGAFAVEIIEKSMADREDGQRGFLITGQEEFLEKYVAGEQNELPEFFARLRALISRRGREMELSERVDRLVGVTGFRVGQQTQVSRHFARAGIGHHDGPGLGRQGESGIFELNVDDRTGCGVDQVHHVTQCIRPGQVDCEALAARCLLDDQEPQA